MASFIDIFNPSFFMFLGIVVLVAALLIVYFESKMREQNHKISSMFSLVTAITDELNSVKMIALSGGGGGIRPNYIVPEESPTSSDAMPTIEITLGESITLIEVSDDEGSEEEDGEEEDSGSSSDESDSDSDEVKESPEIIEIGDLKLSDIKILNVNLMSGNSSTQSFWEAAVKEIIECSF